MKFYVTSKKKHLRQTDHTIVKYTAFAPFYHAWSALDSPFLFPVKPAGAVALLYASIKIY